MADMKLPELGTTLVIKAPNQKICDQTIKCKIQWTVKQLKQHLSEVYPSQPKENQQRIIYSGRLLHDHLTLKEILKHGDEVHTMHLVCPSEKSSPSTEQKYSLSDNVSSSNSQQASQAGPSPASTLSEEELHSMYREYYAYVYQWYQQQMFQYFSNPPTESPPNVDPTPTQPSSIAQDPPAANGARPAAPPAAAPAIAAGPGAIGGEFDDENFERDWLDWFYYALRVAILIGLLNYYSSWTKIITAISIVAIFTLYRFVFQRRNAPPAQEQPAQHPQQPQQEAAPAQANSSEAERPAETLGGNDNRENGTGSSNVTEAATEPIVEVQESFFRKIMNSFYLFSQFCVTLITSLVPERVPPLDLD